MVEVLCDEGFIVDVQDGRKRQRRPLQLLVKALSFVAASYVIRRHVPNGIVGFSQNSLDKNARLGDQALGLKMMTATCGSDWSLLKRVTLEL